jgi:hypothetical protein
METAAAQRFLPQTAGYVSNVSKAQPRNGNNKELWDE